MKPLALNGWTLWGNRCRTLGLWLSVRLVATGKSYVECPYVRTVSVSKGKAALWAQVMLSNVGSSFKGTLRARIIDLTTGKAVWEDDTPQAVAQGSSYWEKHVELKNPRLWWPNGLGDHPLYKLELTLLDKGKQLDRISTRFGVRLS